MLNLKEFFPRAAAQVQHLLVSACSAGTQANVEDIFVKAFPNLRTFWGYYGACPLAGGPDLMEWIKETSGGDVHSLLRKGGSGVTVWNEGKYQGEKSLSKAASRQRVDSADFLYQQFFDGTKESSNPDSGELFEYYNAVRDLLGRADLTRAEKDRYAERRNQAVRLRFYKSIAKFYTERNHVLLNEGYGGSAPDFATMTRKQALQKIADFDKEATGSGPKKLAAKANLENCLRDLNSSCTPESWLQH